MVEALRNALNEADFNAAAMAEETVAVWKDDAPANAETMTRSKLRNFTKKKKAWAEFEMGSRYSCGRGGLHQSDKEAIKWLAKAARQGYAKAQGQLGLLYQLGRCVPQSDQKAMEYNELSARQGFAGAEHSLGLMFYLGQGIEKDWNKARDWWTRAASQGYQDASKNLQELDEEERNKSPKIESHLL